MQKFVAWLENRDYEMIKYMSGDELPDWLYKARGKAMQHMKNKEKMSADNGLTGDQHKIDINKDGKITAADFALLRNKQKMVDKKMMSKDGGLVGDQHKLDVDHDGEITGKDFAILRSRKNESVGSHDKFQKIYEILKELKPEWDINVKYMRGISQVGLGPMMKFAVDVPLDDLADARSVAQQVLVNMLRKGAGDYKKPDYAAIHAQYEKERRDPGHPGYVSRGGWTGD